MKRSMNSVWNAHVMQRKLENAGEPVPSIKGGDIVDYSDERKEMDKLAPDYGMKPLCHIGRVFYVFKTDFGYMANVTGTVDEKVSYSILVKYLKKVGE